MLKHVDRRFMSEVALVSSVRAVVVRCFWCGLTSQWLDIKINIISVGLALASVLDVS